MATNIDRAADIIEDLIDEPHLYPDGGLPDAAAQALTDAGLLAPDLPDANDDSLPLPTRSWELDAEGSPVVWTAPGTTVMIQRIEPGDLTPAEARDLALNILAAADYAEGVPMTPTFSKEWRTIDPYDSGSVARRYGNRAEAHEDVERFPFRVVQHRLVSDWETDQ